MARILIRDDTPVLERLLAAVAARAGHDALVLDAQPRDHVDGDLLLVDPLAAGAEEWASRLRAADPTLPVVCVGGDPLDPQAAALRPAAVVPKPFTIAALHLAIAETLRHAL